MIETYLGIDKAWGQKNEYEVEGLEYLGQDL